MHLSPHRRLFEFTAHVSFGITAVPIFRVRKNTNQRNAKSGTRAAGRKTVSRAPSVGSTAVANAWKF